MEPHGLTAVVPVVSSAEPAEAAISRCEGRAPRLRLAAQSLGRRVGGHPLRIPLQRDSCGFLRRWVNQTRDDQAAALAGS